MGKDNLEDKEWKRKYPEDYVDEFKGDEEEDMVIQFYTKDTYCIMREYNTIGKRLTNMHFASLGDTPVCGLAA